MIYILQHLSSDTNNANTKQFLLRNVSDGKGNILLDRATEQIQELISKYDEVQDSVNNTFWRLFESIEKLGEYASQYPDVYKQSTVFEICNSIKSTSVNKDIYDITDLDDEYICLDFDFNPSSTNFDKRYYFTEQIIKQLFLEAKQSNPQAILYKSNKGYHAIFELSPELVHKLGKDGTNKLKLSYDVAKRCSDYDVKELDLDIKLKHCIKQANEQIKPSFVLTLDQLELQEPYITITKDLAILPDVFVSDKDISLDKECTSYTLAYKDTQLSSSISDTELIQYNTICSSWAKHILETHISLCKGASIVDVVPKYLDNDFSNDFLSLNKIKQFFTYRVELPEARPEENDTVHILIDKSQSYSRLVFVFHKYLANWDIDELRKNGTQELAKLLKTLNYPDLMIFLQNPYILIAGKDVLDTLHDNYITLANFNKANAYNDPKQLDVTIIKKSEIHRYTKPLTLLLWEKDNYLTTLTHRYNKVVFVPYNPFVDNSQIPANEQCYNTFKPSYTQWVQDKDLTQQELQLTNDFIEAIHEVMLVNLCNNNQEMYNILHKWIVRHIQRPYERCNYFVALVGAGGVGKSLLVSVLFDIIGNYTLTVQPSRIEATLFGKYNYQLFENQIANLDEIPPKIYTKAIEDIKLTVGNNQATSKEGKYKDPSKDISYLWLILTSNHTELFRPNKDERRMLMFHTVEIQKPNDKKNDPACILADRCGNLYKQITDSPAKKKILNYLYCYLTQQDASDLNIQASYLPPVFQNQVNVYLSENATTMLDVIKIALKQLVSELNDGKARLCEYTSQNTVNLNKLPLALRDYLNNNTKTILGKEADDFLTTGIKQELTGTYVIERDQPFTRSLILGALESKVKQELVKNPSYKFNAEIRSYYGTDNKPHFEITRLENIRLVAKLFKPQVDDGEIRPFKYEVPTTRYKRYYPTLQELTKFVSSDFTSLN